MVIINRNRNTGIVLTDREKTVRVIFMDEGPLDVQEIPKKQVWKDYFPLKNYDDAKAAAHYLRHSAGVTLRAKRELDRLLGNPVDSTEPTTTVQPLMVQSRGVVRDQIWQFADAQWEASGKPMDKKVVLALRKAMMPQLEKEYGIKVTTSSNELGNWMKARVA